MHTNPGLSPYSRHEHADAPLKYPICGTCGAVWKQRGDRTGHCSGCGQTFEGIKLFDAHQHITDTGVICLDPLSMKVAGRPLRLVEGAWRGAALPQGLFGTKAAPADDDDEVDEED